MSGVSDGADHSGGSARSSRGWAAGALVIAALLALVVFAPGWALRAYQKHQADELIDRVDGQRADVLERAEQAGAVLEVLGAPVRSWSEIGCSLRPRYSDGDGEQDVVVLYYQACVPVAVEVYALPAEHRTLKQAAALLQGRVGHWTPTCNEPLLDVLELGFGEIDESGYSMDLRWIEPSSDEASRADDCLLPAPGEGDTVRTRRVADGQLTAQTYVVLIVRGGGGEVRVGCERQVGWIGSCTDTPEGAPYL